MQCICVYYKHVYREMDKKVFAPHNPVQEPRRPESSGDTLSGKTGLTRYDKEGEQLYIHILYAALPYRNFY